MNSEAYRQPRLVRSRALGMVGAAMVASATRLWFPAIAQAGHGQSPPPCHGYGSCHACSGGACTVPGCVALHNTCSEGDGHCWWTCSAHKNYHCCDHKAPTGAPFDRCICRGVSSVAC